MRTLLILFLSATACLGQLTIQQMQPFFNGARPSSGPPGPNTIANLRYWWHSADMTTNTAVTNWIDEIQGSIWTNGATSLQPTNSALGVGFVGTTSLTNTVPFFLVTDASKGTGTVYIVFSPQTSSGTLGGMIASSAVGGRGVYSSSGNQIKAFAQVQNGILCNYAPGTQFDLGIVCTNQSTGPWVIYTNNVFINNSSGGGDIDSGAGIKFMGKDGTGGGDFFKGQIRDVLVYYGALSAANISTLHTYFTNLYTFSP